MRRLRRRSAPWQENRKALQDHGGLIAKTKYTLCLAIPHEEAGLFERLRALAIVAASIAKRREKQRF
jgi:hypothetical protein